jgi:hypothetical protein
MLRAVFAFLLAFGAISVHAQTYKWVDERGVVNYSNTPPSSGATPSMAQSVPDRVSSYSTDRETANAVDVYRRLDANQQEWLQRQQIMAMQAAAAPQPAASDYYAPAYYPPAYGFVNSRRVLRPAVFMPVRNAPRPAPRASLRSF